MITIVCSSQNPDEKFKKHVIETCGLKNVEFIFYKNENEFSLTELYNKAIKESKYDVITYLHHDIEIRTNNWGNKLLKHFKRNPEYGILGVAGGKEMPVSGMWWENPKTMYGQVYHTHEGKTWLSKYSNNINNQIQETVIVDGVFFSIDRTRIKKHFNEDVKGFHFYDIDFSFNNHINGVKVGVHFDISINHFSIGQTNEKWEENRAQFVFNYKENLPQKIKRVLLPGEKLKVLIGCLNFNNYTGSELYFYELAKELIKLNCDVTVCSNIFGGDLAKRANTYGIKTYNINEPPGYKLGDGKWLINTNNGPMVSEINKLYPVEPTSFDVLHLSHKPITEFLLKAYPNVPVISTIHSEVIDLEYPVIDDSIKRYVAIRPEIKEFLIKEFGISENIIDIIYNPIDSNRFKASNNVIEKKRVLFVGTMDYLREKTIKDLIERTKLWGKELYLVGKNNGIDLTALLENNNHVKYFPSTWNVENYIKECDTTAGILLGRTTIESWMCNKPSIIYDINKTGEIIDKKVYPVPQDLDKFKACNVAKEILEKYLEII